MMIKILQATVCGLVALIALAGAAVLVLAPDRMGAFGQLVGIVLPVFFGSVVPALIGTPLTEAVRAYNERKAQAPNV